MQNNTPRDDRAAARDQRREHLQLPNHGLGRGDLIRSRSPSPAAAAPGTFTFPPIVNPPGEGQFRDALEPIMATDEQLAAIREELRNEMRAEMRNEAAASAATIPDAIKRKPEIPAFDKAHVDHWIRRTENAFIRALITSPREKFAFLETKFPVDFNPRINDFLWGAATNERWDEFLTYLRAEYGPTKQQKVATILDGLKRDGRKPSQYAALLLEKTKDLTLDDVRKEMLVREMPSDIQRMLQERIEGLSLEDAAKTADAYFDQDGKPRHVNKSVSINSVQNTPNDFTTPYADEADDVNAINRRFPNQRNSGNQRNRNPPTKGGSTPNFQRPTPGAQRPISTPKSKPQPLTNDPSLCYYHNWYGDRAKKCDVGCSRFDEKRFPGNGKAGK